MSLPAPQRRSGGDPVIGLINVVFLMLIFFLVAGTIAPSPPASVALVRMADVPPQAPADALVLTADGALWLAGEPTDPAAYLAAQADPALARLMPDRDVPAARLVAVASDLRAAGADRVVVLGEVAQ